MALSTLSSSRAFWANSAISIFDSKATTAWANFAITAVEYPVPQPTSNTSSSDFIDTASSIFANILGSNITRLSGRVICSPI